MGRPGRFEALRDEIGACRPREILARRDAALPPWLSDPAQPEGAIPRAPVDDRAFDADRARRELLAHFGVATLEAFGCEGRPRATAAAGAALRYVRETQKRDLAHVTSLTTRAAQDVLTIDTVTRRNLELVESFADGSRRGTLLDVLDHTRTAMGTRLLREWILRPLVELERVQDRLDAVEELAFRALDRGRLREALAAVQDLDRLLGRVAMGTAGPRDLAALGRSLRALPGAAEAVVDCVAPARPRARPRSSIPRSTSPTTSCRRSSTSRPRLVREGGFVRDGVDPELDELRSTSRGGRETIAAIEQRERERTGIQSLKVRFNRVFGYYIEVSKPNLPLVPADYVRKQTIAGGERFVTPELKDYEDRVLRADELILERETRLFEELRGRVAAGARRIQQTSRAAAALDVLASLAEAATRYDYVKPRLVESDELSYVEGRHPVMERVLSEPFVANDLAMGDAGPRLFVLTGPNMGGKSTFLRQTALVVLMAQMGSFVPAREAQDRPRRPHLHAGRRERPDPARPVHVHGRDAGDRPHPAPRHAAQPRAPRRDRPRHRHVRRPLDRVGGGRAPRARRARPEDDLRDPLPRARRPRRPTCRGSATSTSSAREWQDSVVFLRKIETGGSDRSFGIHVARLAGLPAGVVVRAQEILRNLESTEFDREGRPRLAHSDKAAPGGARQLTLFSGQDDAVLEELRRADPDRLTPLEALALLAELRKRLSR